MRKTISTSSMFILLAVSNAIAQANLLNNGSFESPPGLAAYGDPTDWDPSDRPYHSNPSMIVPPNSNYPAAEDGGQYIGIGTEADGTHDYVAQTVFLSAGTYVLSWYDSAPYVGPAYTTAPYIMTVFGATGGQVIGGSFDAFHGTSHPWVPRSMNVVIPSAGSYTFKFLGNCPPSGLGACIDNVSLSGSVDLVATLLEFDISNSGVDFQYRVDAGPLSTDTTAKLFWASGPSAGSIIASAERESFRNGHPCGAG